MKKIRMILVVMLAVVILADPCVSVQAAKKATSKVVLNGITKNLNVKVKFRNGSKKQKNFGHDFSLQRKEQGKWQDVPMKEGCAFDCVAVIVPAKKSVKYSYPLKTYFEKEQLVSGLYRIRTSYNVKKKNRYVKFRID